jgi:hypothetical protein
MKMVVNISGELYELDYDHIDKFIIKSEAKIGNACFMTTDQNISFSCYANSWKEYKIWRRDNKINQIIQK